MELRELFRNPSAEYRQAPFWFWNHALDPASLLWQIEEMHDKGLGGFVMHARHGLITPYLSDEWFDAIRLCCRKARELGMIPWAYDERDWPSGPAGGSVIEDHANRMSYLRCDRRQVSGPAREVFAQDVMAAFLETDGTTARLDLAGADIPEGTHTLLEFVRFESPAILWFESYLDTLSAKACNAFVRSTYDLHEDKLGDLHALGLAGFFTDEPAFSTYPDDMARIPWTGVFVETFRAVKGYDLLDQLPALFSKDSPGGSQVRYDYWDVATSLFESAFFQQIEQWCEKRKIELIGHALGEEALFYQFRCVGDLFRHIGHLHRPGLDHLGIHVGKGTPGALNPKMIESAALLAGRERTMTETFGDAGWGLDLPRMKWMTDWQLAHGINYIIPHAFFYSIAGRRKRDAPPSEFVQSPGWAYYRTFADYTARITAVMTGGEHVAKVALLYPMASLWASFVPGEPVSAAAQQLEAAFAPLGERLLELHRDFVIIDDRTFASLEAEDGYFTVNGLKFEALVIPPLTAIPRATLHALRKLEGRATVVAVQPCGVRILGGASGETVDVGAMTGVHSVSEITCEALAHALDPVREDVIIRDAPDIHYLHRRKEGKDFYFLANTGLAPIHTTVAFDCPGEVSTWNPETGEIACTPGQHMEDQRATVPVSLAPMGSILLSVNPARDVADVPVIERASMDRMHIATHWHFTPENGNFLQLNHWDFSVQTSHRVTELRYVTQFTSVDRLANMRLILDGVPARAFNLLDASRPILADEADAEILFDGKPVTTELPWEIDPTFRVVSLQNLCGPGHHFIEIVIKNNGWAPQPGLEEVVWLAGDFAVDPADPEAQRLMGVRGTTVGPWERHGFPYFSGTGAYYSEATVSADLLNGRRVFLNVDRVGSILEVEINGHPAGLRLWPPYRLEVTEWVKPGENLFVLKVANTARNLIMGPDPDQPSGLLTDPWLEFC